MFNNLFFFPPQAVLFFLSILSGKILRSSNYWAFGISHSPAGNVQWEKVLGSCWTITTAQNAVPHFRYNILQRAHPPSTEARCEWWCCRRPWSGWELPGSCMDVLLRAQPAPKMLSSAFLSRMLLSCFYPMRATVHRMFAGPCPEWKPSCMSVHFRTPGEAFIPHSTDGTSTTPSAYHLLHCSSVLQVFYNGTMPSLTGQMFWEQL